MASEPHGIPIGWAVDGANRNDVRLLDPTLDAVADTGLHLDIGLFAFQRGVTTVSRSQFGLPA